LKLNQTSVVDKKLTHPSGDKHDHLSLASISETKSQSPTAKNGPSTL
jgi:hypothetical protein